MKKTLLILLLAVVAGWGPAQAQPNAAGDPEAALYRALGGRAGIEGLMADFVPRLAADPRIAAKFKDSKLDNLRQQLSDQVCQLAGGPCRYEGNDMKAAHEDLGIRMADFNALVEDLQLSMEARGIPFAVQNRLLARLAPMHRDIVTR